MKGIKIEVEHEKPIFLYRPFDVVDAIAYAIYYTANPDTEMCIPNCAYEKADKMFKEWKDEVREKKAKEKFLKEVKDKMNEEHTVSLEELGEIKTVKVYNQAYVAKLEEENAILKKALHLYVDLADECGIAWDNFPDMEKKWHKVVEEKGLGWIDGLIFMVTEEAKEQLMKETNK